MSGHMSNKGKHQRVLTDSAQQYLCLWNKSNNTHNITLTQAVTYRSHSATSKHSHCYVKIRSRNKHPKATTRILTKRVCFTLTLKTSYSTHIAPGHTKQSTFAAVTPRAMLTAVSYANLDTTDTRNSLT